MNRYQVGGRIRCFDAPASPCRARIAAVPPIVATVIKVLSCSRRELLLVAGAAAVALAFGTSCSSGTDERGAATDGSDSPAVGLLAGVHAEVRRDPG
jgi:hypothetical protein